MGQRRDRLVEGEVDLACDEIADDLGRAGLIGHELEFGAGDLLEVDAADVLAGA
jgi:hypothetical protein